MTQPMEPVENYPSLWYCPPGSLVPAKTQPILLVHGMWGWHWVWSHFVQTFSDAGYPCYAVDMVGHGPDTHHNPPPGNLQVSEYVAELKKTMELITARHDNTPPLVMGYSMGGLIVQKTLETTPAAGLVLISSAAPKGILVLPPFHTLFILVKYLIKSFFTPLVEPDDKEVYYLAFHHMTGEELKLALERVVPEYSRAYRQIILGRVPVESRHITCPVLVVGGGQDRMVTSKSNQQLAKKYNASLIIFAQASHWLAREEGWQDVCNYILKWATSKQ